MKNLRELFNRFLDAGFGVCNTDNGSIRTLALKQILNIMKKYNKNVLLLLSCNHLNLIHVRLQVLLQPALIYKKMIYFAFILEGIFAYLPFYSSIEYRFFSISRIFSFSQ